MVVTACVEPSVNGASVPSHADFETAWQVFLSKRTEADFQAWRDQRDWTERKYATWAAGRRVLA
jgi:hypothetical protein